MYKGPSGQDGFYSAQNLDESTGNNFEAALDGSPIIPYSPPYNPQSYYAGEELSQSLQGPINPDEHLIYGEPMMDYGDSPVPSPYPAQEQEADNSLSYSSHQNMAEDGIATKEIYYIGKNTYDINDYINPQRARILLEAFQAADLYKKTAEAKFKKINRESKVFDDPDGGENKISAHNIASRLRALKIVKAKDGTISSYRSDRSFKPVPNPDYTPGSGRQKIISANSLYVIRSQKKKADAEKRS
jgi:hypothetical protein